MVFFRRERIIVGKGAGFILSGTGPVYIPRTGILESSKHGSGVKSYRHSALLVPVP